MSVHRDSVEYWKQRTAEAASGDRPVPKQEVYQQYLDLMAIEPGMSLLDIGIGFGRFVPDYHARGARIWGVDVDANMLASAKAEHGEVCEALKVAPAENTGFADGQFDRVVCWAVFDELKQGPSLLEISRVLAVGGLAVLTGKNAEYESDDEQAIAAERGCRAKNHPNHFTFYRELDLSGFGLEPVVQRFFKRRGDFAAHECVETMPERFYEYAVVLKKTGPARFSQDSLPEIADTHSRTWRESEGGRT